MPFLSPCVACHRTIQKRDESTMSKSLMGKPVGSASYLMVGVAITWVFTSAAIAQDHSNVKRRLLDAVQSGEISERQASAMMQALRATADETADTPKTSNAARTDVREAFEKRVADLKSALENGRLSQGDFEERMAVVKERMALHKASEARDSKTQEGSPSIKAMAEKELAKAREMAKKMLAEGKISKEDAERKIADLEKRLQERLENATANRNVARDQMNDKVAAAAAEIRAAVANGNLSPEAAREKMAAIRERIAGATNPDTSSEKPKRDGDLKNLEQRLRMAVESGKMTGEEARAKLMAFKESLSGKQDSKGDQKDQNDAVRQRLENAGKEFRAAVEKGLITREEADEKLRTLRERLRKDPQSDR
jgi:polyhydroxyalkanoate synthesis regulator phasin